MTLDAKLADLLFELGTEELPATQLADLFESGSENLLEKVVRRAFESRRIACREARVLATPRRLVFCLKGVGSSQSAAEQRIRLIPKSEAYDGSGKPSEKLLTILNHRGARHEELVAGDLNGKEYVFLRKVEPAQKTAALLPELFTELVKSLPFPKTMRWDDSGLAFPRPIRSALCLFGDRAVPFRIGNVRVLPETVIFAKGVRKRFAVRSISHYFAVLNKNGVILDPAERKGAIRAELEIVARAAKGAVHEDAFLLNEVNFLTENPHGLGAAYPEAYLKLPSEVLTVSLARKQRLFCLTDKAGRIQPRFVSIVDGAPSPKDAGAIGRNIENILNAKLQDSLFFFREDTKHPLEAKQSELSTLIFLKNAGSMLDKSHRLTALVRRAASWLGLTPDEEYALTRGAILSKVDLLSHMVGEFPELQGIMGKYYASASGEKTAVAEAIGEQYLPRTASDPIPKTKLGAVLSVLDKCDLVAACFALGQEPTSSLDPFGLRRSATGVMRILLDHRLALPLEELLSDNLGELGRVVSGGVPPQTGPKLFSFFQDRFKALLLDRGYREDFIEAALAVRFRTPLETAARVDALSRLKSDEAFVKACKVVERTSNILKGVRDALPETVNPGHFSEELERRVFSLFEERRQDIQKAVQSGDVPLATNLYAAAFFDILSEFFEKVFVNAEDPVVRINRLALLRAVNRLYAAHIADLSKIRL